MQIRSTPLRWLGLVSILLTVTPAGAQDAEGAAAEEAPSDAGSGVEEIVVRGTDAATLDDFTVADSVTAFNVADLVALGAQSIEDLASFTPNLEIVTSGATTPTFFIRGVGLNDFNPNSTGAVAIYQDDVAINAPAMQLGTIFDVETVNILRGPQGTGLARNSSAGAIKVYSRKPTGQFGGYLRSEFGNYHFQDYEGAIEAPILKELLSGRLAFRLTQRDGTMRNGCARAPVFGQRPVRPNDSTLGDVGPWSSCGEPVSITQQVSLVPAGLPKDMNDMDNWAARGNLLFQPTVDTSFILNAHGGRRDELSRVGQSIGTTPVPPLCKRGTICLPRFVDDNGVRIPEGDPRRSVPSLGRLGGPQSSAGQVSDGYIPAEIRRRTKQLAPCAIDPSGTGCGTFSGRVATNTGLLRLSEELADELDPEPWEGDFNFAGPTTNDVWGGYLKSEFVLWGLLEQLTTTTAVDGYDRLIAIDLDFSPETLFHITTDDEGIQFYQDAVLAGELGDTGLRWELGAWYLREQLEVTVINDFGDTVISDLGVKRRDFTQDTDSLAGFAYFSHDFLDDFTVDGGYRYNWERKQFDMDIFGAALSATPPENCTRSSLSLQTCQIDEHWASSTGTLRLLYRFSEETNASWRYTHGWKPGSINATASQFSGPTVAKPESINAFELGLHGTWLNRMLGLDGSVFYYDYDGYQIFIAQQFLGGNPEFVLLNANDAEVYGSEIAAVVRPWPAAFAEVRFSWLETQFLDFVRRDQFQQPGQPIASRETQFSGNALLNSPEFKVSITAEQGIPLGKYGSFSVRYDGVWTDITYYDSSEGVGLGDAEGNFFLPDTTIAQVPFWLHNLRATWRAPSGNIEIAGWVRNLTNEGYKTFAFDASNFQRTTIYFIGDPRTYGMSVVVTF